MKLVHSICFRITLMLFCIFVNFTKTLAADSLTTTYENLFDSLSHISLDPAKIATVNNILIQRDVGLFNLIEGKLYVCIPVMGRTCVMLFVGKGTFMYTPPTDVEQDQLYRFYEKKSLAEPFNTLLLVFGDSTFEQIQNDVTFSPEHIPSSVKENLRYCLKYVCYPDEKYMNEHFATTMLQKEYNTYFYAHFSTDKLNPLFFTIDPFSEEPVIFSRRAKGGFIYHYSEVINQFHTQDYYNNKPEIEESHRQKALKTSHYIMDCSINPDLDFSAKATMTFTSLSPNQQWIYFYLYHQLQVDSVSGMNGERHRFFSNKGNSVFWIECNPPLQVNSVCSLQVYYHGDLLKKIETLGWINLQSPDWWYPRYDYKNKTTFDLTFHTPYVYKFLSIGNNISTKDEGEVSTSQWISNKPIRNASFNIGHFQKIEKKDTGTTPVEVYFSDPASIGFLSGGDMTDQVLFDVQNSLLFYKQVYGTCTTDTLRVTEIPEGHGEAFPGLVHLSWTTFQLNSWKGGNEIFRAHEVAHQWWGIDVDYKTYHDQWLSEGFADYSGLWYYQTSQRKNEQFFSILHAWKEQIVTNRKFILGNGKESGPIWLGSRTNLSETNGDYDLIIYKKGAWVLHMLRMLTLDLKTMNEDKFKGIIQDFYSTYRDSIASTDDFQAIVEKHMGGGMGWFFKEWVYDTKIPKYTFAYKSEKVTDGKYKVTCRIKQENVGDEFQMAVPVRINFANDKLIRLRLIVNQPVSVLELPLFPFEPKEIIFNDMQSVLCEQENEDWD